MPVSDDDAARWPERYKAARQAGWGDFPFNSKFNDYDRNHISEEDKIRQYIHSKNKSRGEWLHAVLVDQGFEQAQADAARSLLESGSPPQPLEKFVLEQYRMTADERAVRRRAAAEAWEKEHPPARNAFRLPWSYDPSGKDPPLWQPPWQ